MDVKMVLSFPTVQHMAAFNLAVRKTQEAAQGKCPVCKGEGCGYCVPEIAEEADLLNDERRSR